MWTESAGCCECSLVAGQWAFWEWSCFSVARDRGRSAESGPQDLPVSREIGDGRLGLRSDEVQEQLKQLAPGSFYTCSLALQARGGNDSSEERRPSHVRWLRPSQLVKMPKILVDGATRDDIMQGHLGDCWFLSSAAAIAQNSLLMSRVLPKQQKLWGADYKGAVKVRFWRYGEWVEVWIDDRLPCNREKEILFAHNSDPSEFWVALLEKAYAKMHGSYEAIEGGQAMDALVDLTGGLAERYELSEHTYDLYLKLCRANQTGAFITCSRKGDWKALHTTVDEFGLIAGHAYTITDVKRIKRKHGYECLLRVRNPWGMGQEWNGAWADHDDRWNLVSEETKKWLNFVKKSDGEFWMCYKDFVKHFQEVTICTVGPDFDGDGKTDPASQILSLHGSWIVGESAGGCRNSLSAFARNPQYLLTVPEADRAEDWMDGDSTCSVVIALMQEHRRSQRHMGVLMLQIGFLIYEVPDDEPQRLAPDHFAYNYENAKSGVYVNFREVVGRFELPPGYYVIIPTTYNKDEAGTFLLRVFAAKRIHLKELPTWLECGGPELERRESSFTLRSEMEDPRPPPVADTPAPSRALRAAGLADDDYEPEIAAAMAGSSV